MSTPADQTPVPPDPAAADAPVEDAAPVEDTPDPAATDAIQPGMTSQEIKDAGLMIEVPFESGDPKQPRLKYADDAGEAYEGPPEGWSPAGGTATTPEGIDEPEQAGQDDTKTAAKPQDTKPAPKDTGSQTAVADTSTPKL